MGSWRREVGVSLFAAAAYQFWEACGRPAGRCETRAADGRKRAPRLPPPPWRFPSALFVGATIQASRWRRRADYEPIKWLAKRGQLCAPQPRGESGGLAGGRAMQVSLAGVAQGYSEFALSSEPAWPGRRQTSRRSPSSNLRLVALAGWEIEATRRLLRSSSAALAATANHAGRPL